MSPECAQAVGMLGPRAVYVKNKQPDRSCFSTAMRSASVSGRMLSVQHWSRTSTSVSSRLMKKAEATIGVDVGGLTLPLWYLLPVKSALKEVVQTQFLEHAAHICKWS